MSQTVERNARQYELVEKVHLLQQERDLTIMELSEFKDRESQLRRLNQTLMKALTEQKPDNALLHEIKLIIQQTSGTERQKALEAEIDRIRKNLDKEIESRIQQIIHQGKIDRSNAKCLRCEELQDKILKLESEVKRISIFIVNLTEEKSHLIEQLTRATDDISTLQRRKTDVECDLRRVKSNQQCQLQKRKSIGKKEKDLYQNQRINKIEAEWKERLAISQKNSKNQIEIIKQELQESYEQFVNSKINEIANQYEETLQQKMNQADQKHQIEINKLLSQINTNYTKRQSKIEFEDASKIISRITPINIKGNLENSSAFGNFGGNLLTLMEQESSARTFQMAKPAKSRAVFLGTDNRQDIKQQSIKGEIQNIISGLTKVRQSNGNGTYQTGTNISTAGHTNINGQISEYGNFTIKDAINRPNLALQSHLRLKRNIF